MGPTAAKRLRKLAYEGFRKAKFSKQQNIDTSFEQTPDATDVEINHNTNEDSSITEPINVPNHKVRAHRNSIDLYKVRRMELSKDMDEIEEEIDTPESSKQTKVMRISSDPTNSSTRKKSFDNCVTPPSSNVDLDCTELKDNARLNIVFKDLKKGDLIAKNR